MVVRSSYLTLPVLVNMGVKKIKNWKHISSRMQSNTRPTETRVESTQNMERFTNVLYIAQSYIGPHYFMHCVVCF